MSCPLPFHYFGNLLVCHLPFLCSLIHLHFSSLLSICSIDLYILFLHSDFPPQGFFQRPYLWSIYLGWRNTQIKNLRVRHSGRESHNMLTRIPQELVPSHMSFYFQFEWVICLYESSSVNMLILLFLGLPFGWNRNHSSKNVKPVYPTANWI